MTMPAGPIPSGIVPDDEAHVLRAASRALQPGPQILRHSAVISPQLFREHVQIAEYEVLAGRLRATPPAPHMPHKCAEDAGPGHAALPITIGIFASTET